MGDSPMSTSASPQRKLPIPASGANTNSTLKGILIKPKRILPAQPDNQKLKRNVQQTTSCEYKADDTTNETSRADFNPSCKSENANKNSLNKVTIPKLLIDVDKLKTHFQLQGKATGRAESRKKDLNENEIEKNLENDICTPVRSQSECGNVTREFISKENKFYDSDGLTKVKEWCSVSEIGNMTTKMSTDSPATKSIERSIRSPSPKSNTTWDRSSSGYSSDERADPRSPPPSLSASVSVSSKTETEITNDDDALASNTEEASENQTDIENENETDELPSHDKDNSDDQTIKAENSASSDSLGTTQSSDNEIPVTENDNTVAQCNSCEANNNGADKNDTTNSCLSLPFDNSVGSKQTSKRSAWTAHSPLPGNGRIQYRKSGSESVISLRHTSRQGIVENHFDGLEVCGKSFPQSASNSSAKNDSLPSDGATYDASGRQDILSPTSAFVQIPKLATSIANESQQNDSSGQEMTPRSRFLRQSLPQFRTPKDIKSLGFGSNVKLTPPKDDKDIRKTLQDLNSPRKQPFGGKSLPIRARHPIQPIHNFDTKTNQPNDQRGAVSDSGKFGIHFSKKMWRAPSGQPENAQTRPFSPFGGTLPPAKIKEHEKKRHDVEGD
ncbi:uncharacterized protein LOC123533616 [Mercenaria mercenaria]|uniref:uncharacterized protein LOC123533616 n=1 Tax=Mercenaria mercenaria TaxID=6596 RepID=UPI00234F615D|nr:uncharacterized protein LOC123533616 [Mercenaria mercenaria]XP_045171267.2 uncharacterized protein LOC123533616 [Mercenaria mercenaria]XP_045171268.2 uncharacterized protein LOC123533616 [Mercenaria mercenaria]XP_045171269.2 uncharacterized protein LOC123533616 [Mercenaria mercenaria]